MSGKSAAGSLNASGLTPEQSKKLETREPNQEEKSILSKITELYTCKPTTATYEIYSKEAVFHDPPTIAEGLDSIKSQFNGMPKLFSKSIMKRQVVLTNPPTLPKSTLLVDQDVEYWLKEDKPFKTVNSLLTLERDSQGKVTRHTEEWDHKKEVTSDDGFFGTLTEWRKKGVAGTIAAFVDKTPPSEKK